MLLLRMIMICFPRVISPELSKQVEDILLKLFSSYYKLEAIITLITLLIVCNRDVKSCDLDSIMPSGLLNSIYTYSKVAVIYSFSKVSNTMSD